MRKFISDKTAKDKSYLIFIEVLMQLKAYCKTHNLNSFYDIAENRLKNTPIIWKKTGFLIAGKTIKFNEQHDIKYIIELNTNYLYSEDANDFIKFTLIHELAHIISDCYDGSFGHNKTFKTFDKILGGRGTRLANYKTPTNIVKRNRIEFVCPTCGNKFSLTPYMVNKCKTGNYQCKGCKTNMLDVMKHSEI